MLYQNNALLDIVQSLGHTLHWDGHKKCIYIYIYICIIFQFALYLLYALLAFAEHVFDAGHRLTCISD